MFRPLPPLIILLTATIAHADFVNFETPHVHPLDLSPDATTLAACNTADNRVELFTLSNTSPPAPAASIPVGLDPVSARFRTATELWVVNQLSDSVSVIDLHSRTVLRTLHTDDEPADVVFAGDPPTRFRLLLRHRQPSSSSTSPISPPLRSKSPSRAKNPPRPRH